MITEHHLTEGNLSFYIHSLMRNCQREERLRARVVRAATDALPTQRRRPPPDAFARNLILVCMNIFPTYPHTSGSHVSQRRINKQKDAVIHILETKQPQILAAFKRLAKRHSKTPTIKLHIEQGSIHR